MSPSWPIRLVAPSDILKAFKVGHSICYKPPMSSTKVKIKMYGVGIMQQVTTALRCADDECRCRTRGLSLER